MSRVDCIVCQGSFPEDACTEISVYGARLHCCDGCDLSQQEAIEPAADDICAEAEALAAIEAPPIPEEIVAPRVRGFLGFFKRAT